MKGIFQSLSVVLSSFMYPNDRNITGIVSFKNYCFIYLIINLYRISIRICTFTETLNECTVALLNAVF